MMHRNFHRAFLCLVLVSAFTGSLVLAQNHPGSRITGPIDERVRVTLKGNVHPLAQLRYDQGAVLDSFPVQRMFLVLRRPPSGRMRCASFSRKRTHVAAPAITNGSSRNSSESCMGRTIQK